MKTRPERELRGRLSSRGMGAVYSNRPRITEAITPEAMAVSTTSLPTRTYW